MGDPCECPRDQNKKLHYRNMMIFGSDKPFA